MKTQTGPRLPRVNMILGMSLTFTINRIEDSSSISIMPTIQVVGRFGYQQRELLTALLRVVVVKLGALWVLGTTPKPWIMNELEILVLQFAHMYKDRALSHSYSHSSCLLELGKQISASFLSKCVILRRQENSHILENLAWL